ncbi:MAG: trigger factor [Bacilli bacterium]
MEKKVEKNGSQVVISFVANGDEWKKAQDKEFNKLSAKLKVDGFRQGHVPTSIAKARINPVEVLQDAMFTLVNKEYANVLNEEKLNVIAEPKLNVTKLSETELECTVTVALPPVVTLGDYKGIKVEKVIKEVTEEDVNDALNKELNNHATLNLKDGAAENGDTVTIDFKGYIDDIPFDGGEARGYDLKLGSNSFVPGFEDQLVGIKSEEERTIDIKFPENYVENLASKDAKFVVKCHEVKQTVLPELNDEFVNELDLEGIKTVEEYKEKIKNDLTEKANRRS